MKWPRPRMIVISLIRVVVAAAVLGTSLLVLFQNRLVYLARRYPSYLQPEEVDPAFHSYTTADGRRQWGYLIEAANTSTSGTLTNSAGPSFYLVFGGNAGTAMNGAEYYKGMARKTGCGFFLVDYRGYGFNAGSPSESGLTADALGAYDTMKAEGRFKDGVGVIGQSLGGGVAFALAVQRPVDRMVTLSTFTSIDDMARLQFPWPLYHFCWNHFPNEKRMKELAARPAGESPAEILIVHGEEDETIPFEMGESLFASATGANQAQARKLSFLPIANATHNIILESTDMARILKRD